MSTVDCQFIIYAWVESANRFIFDTKLHEGFRKRVQRCYYKHCKSGYNKLFGHALKDQTGSGSKPHYLHLRGGRSPRSRSLSFFCQFNFIMQFCHGCSKHPLIINKTGCWMPDAGFRF